MVTRKVLPEELFFNHVKEKHEKHKKEKKIFSPHLPAECGFKPSQSFVPAETKVPEARFVRNITPPVNDEPKMVAMTAP